MKNLMLVILLFVVFGACSSESQLNKNHEEDDAKVQTPAQRWDLVKMTGSMRDSETIGANMKWQEYYLLNPDNTFIKSREMNGSISKAEGIYAKVTLSDGDYLEFTYTGGTNLIGSCTGGNKEYLMIQEDKLNGTWQACDGPGLEYTLASH